jgi:hypothetical protein
MNASKNWWKIMGRSGCKKGKKTGKKKTVKRADLAINPLTY